MSANAQPIGIFDSGMGGLTVLKALRKLLPHEHFVYLGDTARLPYGTKSAETVTHYALTATKELLRHHIKMVVIACNTASSVALAPLSLGLAPLPVIGVIAPGAEAAVKASISQHIAVIATERTVEEKAYERAIYALNPQAKIVQHACPLFVALAEEGWADGEVAEAAIRRYLLPLFKGANPPDTLLLGCTHFPVLDASIAKVIGPHIIRVDSAETTALAVEQVLIAKGLAASSAQTASCRFLATDSRLRFARVGSSFLGEVIAAEGVELVDL